MKIVRSLVVMAGIAALVSSVSAQKAPTQGYADMQTCPEAATDLQQKPMSFAFLIEANGEVVQSKLTRSSGDKALDQKALQALQKCTFHPATFQGKPQISWVMLSHK